MRNLDADEALDYTTGDVAGMAKDIDIVVDAIGGTNSVALLPVLRRGGLIVPVAGGADAGQLRVEIDTVLPLDAAATTHEIGERGRIREKIVLTV